MGEGKSPADLDVQVEQERRLPAPNFLSGWDQASISVGAVCFNWGKNEKKPFSVKIKLAVRHLSV